MSLEALILMLAIEPAARAVGLCQRYASARLKFWHAFANVLLLDGMPPLALMWVNHSHLSAFTGLEGNWAFLIAPLISAPFLFSYSSNTRPDDASLLPPDLDGSAARVWLNNRFCLPGAVLDESSVGFLLADGTAKETALRSQAQYPPLSLRWSRIWVLVRSVPLLTCLAIAGRPYALWHDLLPLGLMGTVAIAYLVYLVNRLGRSLAIP